MNRITANLQRMVDETKCSSQMTILLHGHHVGLITWGREYEERREQILTYSIREG